MWSTKITVQFTCISDSFFGINTQVESKDDLLRGIVVDSR